MDTFRNPLMGSLPCGHVLGVPLRISLLAICVGIAAIFGIGDDASDSSTRSFGTTASDTTSPVLQGAPQDDVAAVAPVNDLDGSTVLSPTGIEPKALDPTAIDPIAINPTASITPESVESSNGVGPVLSRGSATDSLNNETPASTGPAFIRAAPTATSVASPSEDNSLVVGLFVAIALLGSSLIHEIAEVIVGRRAGASVRAIVLMPAGGMTVAKTDDPSTKMATAFIGPVVHLGLCLICLPAVIASGNTAAISLFALPEVSFNEHWFASAGLLLFSVNLKLVVLNMLPIPPLDGAKFIRAWRTSATETETESSMTAFLWNRWGIIGGLLVLSIGLTADSAWTVALGGLVIAWCCGELLEVTSPSQFEQGGFGESLGNTGYAFGGSEFADEEEEIPRERTLGPIARWRAKKDAQKRQREREERAWAEEELDRLLDKVSKVGMDGLTADEKKTLQQVSSRFKQ